MLWNLRENTGEENLRWCLLRAIEWGRWPIFISQPVLPIMLLFLSWQKAVAIVLVCNMAWAYLISYHFVSVALANVGVFVVRLKWILCPGMACYFYSVGDTAKAILSLLWPVLIALIPIPPFLNLFIPRVQIGRLQKLFGAALGSGSASDFRTSSAQEINTQLASDLRAGVNAFEKGDFFTALKDLKPLAEKGNALAQVTLGLMYYHGKGVAQDYHEALKLFLRAADQGEGMAQLSLGFMYGAGQGVQRDFVQAYMRFSLGASDTNVGVNCKSNRELTKHQMTTAQIAEGQRLAKEWQPKTAIKG